MLRQVIQIQFVKRRTDSTLDRNTMGQPLTAKALKNLIGVAREQLEEFDQPHNRTRI